MFGKNNSVRRPASPEETYGSPTLPQGTKRQSSTLKRSPTLSSPTSPNKVSFPHPSNPTSGGIHENVGPARPYLARVPSVQTRYMEMLLHLDEIPRLHNILAALFTWILLAGFLIVPGTFTSFKNSSAFKNASENESNDVARAILRSINNIGLLWVSGAFCGAGTLGCLWLWFRWRTNYVWLLNRVFL